MTRGLKNKQFLLDNRPKGDANVENFKLVTADVPELKEGELLVRHHYLSLDPYMRLRMNNADSYAPPQELGKVMVGGTVGDVIESKNPDYKVGDTIKCFGGWQEYGVVNPAESEVKKIDASGIPTHYYLGAVGMPGITAWIGLLRICNPKPGETVLVSSAAGATGSIVGQLAKAHGCRAIGIAGGDEKCRYVVEQLGFDACVDYKKHKDLDSLVSALKEHAPNGIDCNFENVGGLILDAAMVCMNNFGRVALCGLISGYEGDAQPMTQVAMVLTKRLTIRGFINWDHGEDLDTAEAELVELARSGKLKYRESIAEGLESAPEAFLGMLKGKNLGKQLVKIAEPQ